MNIILLIIGETFSRSNEIAFCGENVNYLINCAKSCYQNFDNDNKSGSGFSHVEWARDAFVGKHFLQLID
jgi:hypothetical protein